MSRDCKQIGECSIYGSWDDVTDNQFLVIWGEAGSTCTVLLLSGYDYGGGVTSASSKVPLKDAEEIINSSLSEIEAKLEMTALVDLYKEL